VVKRRTQGKTGPIPKKAISAAPRSAGAVFFAGPSNPRAVLFGPSTIGGGGGVPLVARQLRSCHRPPWYVAAFKTEMEFLFFTH